VLTKPYVYQDRKSNSRVYLQSMYLHGMSTTYRLQEYENKIITGTNRDRFIVTRRIYHFYIHMVLFTKG